MYSVTLLTQLGLVIQLLWNGDSASPDFAINILIRWEFQLVIENANEYLMYPLSNLNQPIDFSHIEKLLNIYK